MAFNFVGPLRGACSRLWSHTRIRELSGGGARRSGDANVAEGPICSERTWRLRKVTLGVRRSSKLGGSCLSGAASICALLTIFGCRPPGELGDEYVYSDMGSIVASRTKIPLFQPYRSASGYLFIVVPTRTVGHALKGDPYQHPQVVAPDVLCSGSKPCIWDTTKQLDVRCSQLKNVFADRGVRVPVKTYFRANCSTDTRMSV